jgi:hypothetical protein
MADQESKANKMERELRTARGKPLYGNYAGMSVDPDTGKYIDKPTSIQGTFSKSESKADEMERTIRGGRGKALHGNYTTMSVDPKTGEYKNKKVDVGSTKGGGGSGGVSDTREMQLGADLDPKAMMKREGYKKGGKVSSASTRADGIAQRGKTKGRMC